MNRIELPLGEWLPDQADYKNPGLTEAENVYPLEGGYGPFETPTVTSQQVTGTVIGAKQFYRNTGNQVIVGGTDTRLFAIVSGSVTVTTGYSTATSWRFERFNDLLIAVSKENAPQYITDIDTSTAWIALPGSPPNASVVGKVSDFLVLGDLDGFPNRVQWSAFNNPTLTWTTDPGQLSGFQDLDAKYGKVTGIVGGRWGLVFQERAIWRMVFVGAPKAFDFELVTDDRGCVAPDSIVPLGYQTYFMDRDGLYVTNGSEVLGIGSERVNRWLEGEIDPSRRDETHGTVNWAKRCLVWAFKSPGVTGYRRQLVYSFTTERFTAANQVVDWLVQSSQDAISLNELGALFATLGDVSDPLGSDKFAAKDRLFAAFVNDGTFSQYAPFTGPAAAGYVTTGDFTPAPGQRALISGMSPIVERQSGITCQLLHRATQGASHTVENAVEPGADTFAPAHTDDWYHAFRMVFASEGVWDRATAFWIRFKPTGRR